MDDSNKSIFDEELNKYISSIYPSIKKIIRESFPYLYSNNSNHYYSEEDLLQEAYTFAIEAFKKYDSKSGVNIMGWAVYYIESSFKKLKTEFFLLNSNHVSLDDIQYNKKHCELADEIFGDLSSEPDMTYEMDYEDESSGYKLTQVQIDYLENLKIKLNNKSISKYISLIISNNRSMIDGFDASVQMGVSKSRISQIKGNILKYVESEKDDQRINV